MNTRIEMIDSDTGLATRDGFEHLFQFAFSLGNRGVPPTVLLLAPDGGGEYGDDRARLMVDLGQELRNVTRKTDVVARYSDTEFVCLLIDCNTSGGIVAADRLRGALADFTARTQVTLSAGVATYAEWMEDKAALLTEARRALDAAQAAGGDRTELPAPSA